MNRAGIRERPRLPSLGKVPSCGPPVAARSDVWGVYITREFVVIILEHARLCLRRHRRKLAPEKHLVAAAATEVARDNLVQAGTQVWSRRQRANEDNDTRTQGVRADAFEASDSASDIDTAVNVGSRFTMGARRTDRKSVV